MVVVVVTKGEDKAEVGWGLVRGEAWVRAARQAIRRRVRGEGEGRGEDDDAVVPTRWMVVPLGVADGLGEG